jgi:hypothetical protein
MKKSFTYTNIASTAHSNGLVANRIDSVPYLITTHYHLMYTTINCYKQQRFYTLFIMFIP